MAAAAAALLGLLAIAGLAFFLAQPATPLVSAQGGPPDAVGSITLTRSGSTLTVSWNAVSDATKYHALYQADGAGDWLPPIPDYQNITDTSFTFNIDSGKSYVVGVRAGNANGWGAWTDSPVSNPPLPAAVGSITLTRNGSTLTVSWNAVDGAAKYHALYQANGAGDWLPPIPDYQNITATSFTFNIDSDKSYVVGVRAGNSAGWGPWTDSPASNPPLPAAVGSIALTRSDTTLTVSWNAVSDATKYHALYQADGAGDWLPPITDYNNITDTGFTFDVDNAKSYVVGVRAGNSAGWGPWTDSPASGPYTPPAPDPNAGIIVQDSGGNAITTLAVPEGGEASYQVMLATKPTKDTKVCIGLSVRDNNDGDITFKGQASDVVALNLTFTPDNWNVPQTVTLVAAEDNDYANGARDVDHDAREYYSGKVDLAVTEIDNDEITVTATRGSDGDTVSVSWTAYIGDNFEYYRVIVCDDTQYNGASCSGTVWTGAPVWDVNSTGPVSVPDLDPGTGYGVILQVWRNGSAMKSHATLPAGPAAPDNLAVNPGNGYLDLSWNAVSGATAYDIRARAAGVNDWHSVANKVTATTYRYTTDQAIDQVAVRAANAHSVGNWTELSRLPDHGWLNTVQSGGASAASAQSQNQLAAPASVTVTRDNGNNARSIGSEELTVTWDKAVTGADGYNLICSSRSGWRWWHCGSVDSESTTTLKVTKGEHGKMSWLISYMVAVRAVTNNPDQASDWTRSVDAHPAHTPVKEQPGQNPISASRAAGSLTLSWIQPKYSTGYEIECATLENGLSSAYKLCADVETATLGSDRRVTATITQWTVDGSTVTVDDNKTYDLIVRTTNAWGKSPFHYAPLIYPNVALTASDIGTTTANLTIAHHTGQWWYKATTGPHTTCQGPVEANTATKDLTGLSVSASYTYSAYSATGCANADLLATAATFTTGSSISNLSNGKGTETSLIGRGAERAFAFSTGSNNSGYVLRTVTLALRRYDTTGAAGDIRVTLHQIKGAGNYGANSEPADTVLATLSGTDPTSSAWADTTYTCSGSGCNLSSDTTYFVKTAVQNSETFRYDWAWTLESAESKEPSNNGWDILFGHYNDTGARWQSYSDWHLAKLVFVNNP